MGTEGNRPRKPKHRLAKVSKYEEPNNLHLAGLSSDSGGAFGSRLGHATARTRSEDLGRVGRFVLRCLGRPTNEVPQSKDDEKADE